MYTIRKFKKNKIILKIYVQKKNVLYVHTKWCLNSLAWHILPTKHTDEWYAVNAYIKLFKKSGKASFMISTWYKNSKQVHIQTTNLM